MELDSIVYLISPYGETLLEMSLMSFLKYFLVVLTITTLILIIMILLYLDKGHREITAHRIQEALKLDRERHDKMRDAWIDEKNKLEDNNRILRMLNKKLEAEKKSIEIAARAQIDDAKFAAKRRSKKIKKMEMILALEKPQLQLNNPNRSMASIISGYTFPDNI